MMAGLWVPPTVVKKVDMTALGTVDQRVDLKDLLWVDQRVLQMALQTAERMDLCLAASWVVQKALMKVDQRVDQRAG